MDKSMRESSYVKGIETIKSDFRKKVLRFIIVGGSSVLIDLFVYKLLLYASINTTLSKGISFIAVALYAYYFNRKWTFEAGKASLKQGLLFFSTYLFSLSINVNTNATLIQAIPNNISYRIGIAFIIATTLSAMFNFIMMEKLVFTKRSW